MKEKKRITKELYYQKKLKETSDWLFTVFVDRDEKLETQQREALRPGFGAGLLLLANGQEVGYFICSRLMKVLRVWLPNCKTKTSDVLRYINGNEKLFAQSALCSMELLKGFKNKPEKENDDE